ncbi:MAG: ATP-binding protein, partial [Acidobacteriota bacterium]|nr:ATP-binding protein [Acidobacteriota bacterium]
YRKDTRLVIAGLAGLLIVLSVIYYLIQRSRDLPPDLATNKVLLLLLWYINVVLILSIAFMLLRNVVKLLVERQHRLFGSKFKIKLVATYVLLSLVPALLLFAYGSSLLRGWIDDWFEESAFEAVAEQGFIVAEALEREVREKTLKGAHLALAEIADFDISDPARRSLLARRLQELLTEGNVHYLGLYEKTDFVHGVALPQAGFSDLPEQGRRFLLEAMRKGEAQKAISGSLGRTVLAAVASPRDAEVRPVIVAAILIPLELADASAGLIQTRQGYRQLEIQKGSIKATYRLTFLMVTLLILLATTWVGLYLAKRVMVPIEAVAEGTRRLSEGDLDYRVDVPADDELGVLVESFNRMTSELKRSKEELVSINRRLDEERALIEAVLDNVAAGVISADAEGRILTCNRAAAKMLRQESETHAGRHVDQLWADRERGKLANLFLEDSAATGPTVRTLRLFLGGHWSTFEAKVRAMRDSDRKVSGHVMVLEDLTELIRAQQRAAWHDAARRVAHQIKNPLTPIKLSAERILKKYRSGDPELGSALEEGVAIIGKEVDSLKEMVDEFSQFARMRPPRPVPTDMRKLVRETVRLYEGIKSGVRVTGVVDTKAERALIDREQLKQALINLLDNAVEALDSDGEVGVSVHQTNSVLHIRVADTGEGISAKDRDKLFLPHFSTKGRGTGLGLAIVHRIVSEHHGSISVTENEPHGTVFEIDIPQA